YRDTFGKNIDEVLATKELGEAKTALAELALEAFSDHYDKARELLGKDAFAADAALLADLGSGNGNFTRLAAHAAGHGADLSGIRDWKTRTRERKDRTKQSIRKWIEEGYPLASDSSRALMGFGDLVTGHDLSPSALVTDPNRIDGLTSAGSRRHVATAFDEQRRRRLAELEKPEGLLQIPGEGDAPSVLLGKIQANIATFHRMRESTGNSCSSFVARYGEFLKKQYLAQKDKEENRSYFSLLAQRNACLVPW